MDIMETVNGTLLQLTNAERNHRGELTGVLSCPAEVTVGGNSLCIPKNTMIAAVTLDTGMHVLRAAVFDFDAITHLTIGGVLIPFDGIVYFHQNGTVQRGILAEDTVITVGVNTIHCAAQMTSWYDNGSIRECVLSGEQAITVGEHSITAVGGTASFHRNGMLMSARIASGTCINYGERTRVIVEEDVCFDENGVRMDILSINGITVHASVTSRSEKHPSEVTVSFIDDTRLPVGESTLLVPAKTMAMVSVKNGAGVLKALWLPKDILTEYTWNDQPLPLFQVMSFHENTVLEACYFPDPLPVSAWGHVLEVDAECIPMVFRNDGSLKSCVLAENTALRSGDDVIGIARGSRVSFNANGGIERVEDAKEVEKLR